MRNFRPRAGFLALILVFALLMSCTGFVTPGAEAAAAWMQDSLDKLTGWGVLKGYPDGQLHENDNMTRAQFVAMVNRALGYTELGDTPFTDVPDAAWYADDVNIAYNAGYFNGTSATTASPEASLTREQAVAILARNLRLEETVGEVMEFSDGDSFSNWSKGFIRSAVNSGMINGYSDGTFKPQKLISRGEMAKVLTNALGTLVQEQPAQGLSGVYGNLTLNSPDITLRDTTIAGNLYLSGGVGLGGVTLENVRVLGKIVIIGGGESEKGDISIVLRNVTADELLVDSLSGQYTSLSAEGSTVIPLSTIRTNAFIQDNTPDGCGFTSLKLDGKDGAVFNIAGNLKAVENLTPTSSLTVSRGTVEELNIDEKAVGSTLTLANNASIDKLELDSATAVSGVGDIAELNVAVDGCVVDMLPDKITIRPGVTANIAGEDMDTKAAEESSAEPRILAGYPNTASVASTSLTGIFSTNKPGTVYWAVSYTEQGAVSEANLIAPPTAGSNILKSGSFTAAASNTEYTAKITGLTLGGSYYLSAVLVDAHDWRSDVKAVAFTTPDDSVPAFGSGYPYMSQITKDSAQVTALTTKSCELYYVLLPKGSVTPTTAEFLAGKFSGSYGSGKKTMTKNVSESFTVSSSVLTELASYDLYLWLTDADGAKSSPVKKLTFTTVDGTPPEFQTKLMSNDVKTSSIGFTGNLNENGTVYWVVVKSGEEYPKPAAGSTDPEVSLDSEYAKLQVYSGMNGLKSGKTTAKANTDFKFTVSGLEAEKAYDVYYLAVDSAGNYSAAVEMLTANTLDSIAPTATQEFTRYSGNEATIPYADTDIILTFSENIQRASTNEQLLKLYEAVEKAETDAARAEAKNALAAVLSATLTLYNATGAGQPALVKERSSDSDIGWTVDYRNAKLELADSKLYITFRTTDDASHDSALSLSSGGTYFFRLRDIADTSSSKNLMGITDLPSFTTISAQVALAKLNITTASIEGATVPIDLAFSLTPVSTSKADVNSDWDMLIWSDSAVTFKLYRRVSGSATWEQVGSNAASITTSGSTFVGRSLVKHFQGDSTFPRLNALTDNYEYAVHFTELNGVDDRNVWTQRVNLRVSVVSGTSADLRNLSTDINETSFASATASDLDVIGSPKTFEPYVQFTDTIAPEFTGGYPAFISTDNACTMSLLINRPGTVYYAVAPVGTITTKEDGEDVVLDDVPKSGSPSEGKMILTAPGYLQIVNPTFANSRIKTGSVSLGTGVTDVTVPNLEPGQTYYAYYVIKSIGQVYSSVYLYSFTTPAVTRPVITLDLANPVVTVKSDLDASVNYMLVAYNTSSLSSLLTQSFLSVVDDTTGLTDEQKQADFSVLNAMATNVTEGNDSVGSLFDKYASKSAKDNLADYIRGTTPSSSVVGNGTLSPKANTRVAVDCSSMPMSQITQYCFLAVGRSTSGSGDAFRAIYPVTLTDGEAPTVTEFHSSLVVDADGKISGEVRLVFNEEIYYLTPGTGTAASTLQAIDLGPTEAVNRPTSFISILSLRSSPKPYTISLPVDEDYVGQATNTIDIDYSLALSGANVIFKTNLSDKYQNVRTSSLSVSVSTTKLPDGSYSVPTVSISSAWDGRTSR